MDQIANNSFNVPDYGKLVVIAFLFVTVLVPGSSMVEALVSNYLRWWEENLNDSKAG